MPRSAPKAENFPSRGLDAEPVFDLLRQTGKHAFAWMAADLNPNGVVGNAATATAEKGRATAKFQAEGFARLLGDIRKARLKDWLA
jgi:creatinine amidohydrolase